MADRMTQALAEFQEAAEAAVSHWGPGDLTVGQGLHVTWMLGTITHRLQIAGTLLSRFEVTGPDGPAGATTTTPSAPGRTRDLPGQPAPNDHTSSAAKRLEAASTLARRLPGIPVLDASPAASPAVDAARDMLGALETTTGTWAPPSGSNEDRDLIVTEMLVAVDGLEAATLVLAQGGPPDIQESLRQVAHQLDAACIHLRESVACSLTKRPGGADLAAQLRKAFPVISEAGPLALPEPSGPDHAPRLAAAAFPRTAAATAPARDLSPTHRAASGPSHPERAGSRRRSR